MRGTNTAAGVARSRARRDGPAGTAGTRWKMTEMIRAVRRALALTLFLVLFGAQFGFGAWFRLGASGVGTANRLQRPCRRPTDVGAHVAAPRIAPRCRHGASRASDRATDATHVRSKSRRRSARGRREHRRRRSGVRQPERAARQEGRALRRRPVSRARHCRQLRRGRVGAAHGSLTVHHRAGIAGATAVLVGVLLIGFGIVRRARHGGIVRGAIGGAIGGGRAVAVAAIWLGRHHADRARVVGGGTRVRRRRDHRADVGDVGRAAAGSGRAARAPRGRRRGPTTTGRAIRSANTGCATTTAAAPPPTAAPPHRRPRRFRVRHPRRRSRCRGSVPRRIRRAVRTRAWMHPKRSSRATSSC